MLPKFPVIEGVEFRNIPNWEGYAASSDGYAWSCKSGTWVKLKSIVPKSGYHLVNLKDVKRYKALRLNVLIANLFLGGIPAGYVAAHYPHSDKSNNSVSNIKVCTHKENTAHRKEQGTYLFGEQAVNVVLNDALVLDIRKLREEGESIHSLSRLFQVDRGTIKQIVKRQTWTHI